MRKLITSYLIILMAFFGLNAFSQNIVVGGGMDDATKWDTVAIDGTIAPHSFTFNYTDDKPKGSTSGCLRIQGKGTANGGSNFGVQQQVTLKKMTRYKLDFQVKDNSHLKKIDAPWFQLYLDSSKVTTTHDVGDSWFENIAKCFVNQDGLMSSFSGCDVRSDELVLGSTPGDTTLWLILKMGLWNDVADTLDVLIDSVSLTQYVYAPGENLLLGSKMDKKSVWDTVAIDGTIAPHSFSFNYTKDKPTGAKGGCLRILGKGTDNGGSNFGIQQQVTIKKMTEYNVDFLVKDNSKLKKKDAAWFQIYLNDTAVSTTHDLKDHIWFENIGKCFVDKDALKSSLTGCNSVDTKKYIVGNTPGDTTLWFVIKMGLWNDVADTLDVLIDSLSLTEILPAVKVKPTFEPNGDITIKFDYTATEDGKVTIFVGTMSWSTLGVDTIAVTKGSGTVSTVITPSKAFKSKTKYEVCADLYNITKIKVASQCIDSTSLLYTSTPALQRNELSVFPNPVLDLLTVNAENGASIDVIDISGKILIKKKAESSAETVDFSSLKSGIYFVKVKTNSDQMIQKVIKK